MASSLAAPIPSPSGACETPTAYRRFPIGKTPGLDQIVGSSGVVDHHHHHRQEHQQSGERSKARHTDSPRSHTNFSTAGAPSSPQDRCRCDAASHWLNGASAAVDADPAKTWNPDARVYYSRRLRGVKRGHRDGCCSVGGCSGCDAAAVPGVDTNDSLPPSGFPAYIPPSPLIWSGQHLSEGDYLRRLSADDVAEIERALQHFNELNLPLSSIGRDTFPLPNLGQQISSLSCKLYGGHNGRGFFVLRGLNPKKYTSKDNVVIYAGVSSYVAERRGRQDEKNNYLLHLADLGSSVAPDNVRQAPYSNVPQPFHTDTGDILALYTLKPAAQGGRSLLASSWKIYNELASQHPQHLHTLSRCDWAFDSFGRKPAYTLRPLLHYIQNRILLSFSRRPLTGSPVSPRTPGIPILTGEQSDALDTVHFTAMAHSIAISQEAGDLQYWNNFALLHAREGFEDSGEERRHLLRLWLRDDTRADTWGEVPETLKNTWLEAYGEGDWGEEKWPIEPVRDREFVTEQRRSSGHS